MIDIIKELYDIKEELYKCLIIENCKNNLRAIKEYDVIEKLTIEHNRLLKTIQELEKKEILK